MSRKSGLPPLPPLLRRPEQARVEPGQQIPSAEQVASVENPEQNVTLVTVKEEVVPPADLDLEMVEPPPIISSAPNISTTPTRRMTTVVGARNSNVSPNICEDHRATPSPLVNESVSESMNVDTELAAVSAPSTGATRPNSEWKNGKSLAEMMEYILENDEGTRKDVTFIVGPEKQEIATHKIFLALASPEFDYMLYDSPLVRNITRNFHIVLSDVTVKAFKLMLKYIYTKEVDVQMEDAIELLKVSLRFDLPDLVARCMCVLRSGINNETAAEIFHETLTNFPNDSRLKEYALSYILVNAKRVLKTSGFLNLSLDSLCVILASDDLIVKEYDVFQAAMLWAEKSILSKHAEENVKISGQNIRDELGPALFLIRFPLLTPAEFKSHVTPRQILTNDEQLSICYFFLEENKDQSLTDLTPFSKVKRAQKTTVAEATSSTGDNSYEEPPRKILRLELPEEERVLENSSSVATEILEPVEPIPSSSGWTTPPLSRTSSSVVECMDLRSDDDSTSSLSVSESVDAKAAGPSVTPVKCKALRRNTRHELLLSEEEGSYYQEQLNSPSGNTLQNLFERMLHALDINSEDIVEVREEKPVVINPLPVTFPIFFPNLWGFHVNFIKNNITVDRFKHDLKNINLSSLIFYKFCESEDFLEIWLKGINTTIVINGVTILKMDFEKKSLILSRIKQARLIVEGLQLKPTLKSISLDECEIGSLDHIPTEMLESLTLRKVLGIKNRREFLKKCKNLKELSCTDMGDENIDLGIHLGFFEGTKLRRLALGKAKIDCSKPVRKMENNIEELYLDCCPLNLNFIESMPFIFPKLKRIKICRNCRPELVTSLLEIETMEWMCFWQMGFKPCSSPKKGKGRSSKSPAGLSKTGAFDLKQFLKEAGLEVSNNVSSFILEKVPVPGVLASQPQQNQVVQKRWKATKLKDRYEEFTRMDYDQFDWSMFYEDYAVFHKMNR